jgi:hypothetical protein
MMKVMIDGEEVKCLNDVKVIYEDINEEGEELHVTLNGEGMVTDVTPDGSRVTKTYWAEPWHIADELAH